MATAGAGASVLVSGTGAQSGGGCATQTTTTPRVVVSCWGNGGQLTVPGGTQITVHLTGASGGAVGQTPGGRGGRVEARWTPEEDTPLRVALGSEGQPGAQGPFAHGGAGGGDSFVAVRNEDGGPPAHGLPQRWLWIAGGGGGAGTEDAPGGHGGSPDGGPDAPAPGEATGATRTAPGQGAARGGRDGQGVHGGEPHGGGGGGGDGYYGGGGGGHEGGGGGGGSSNADVGDVIYGVADEPGDGTATISWSLAPVGSAPQITSASTASFVAGQRGAFTVTATGVPTPRLSVGPLPAGLSFTDQGNGSGVISGVPAAGYAAETIATVTAANDVQPDATQALQVRVLVPAPPPDPPPPPFTPDFTPDPTSAAQQDPEPAPELVPVAEETIVVVPVSGIVLIRRPDGTVSELKEGEEIPVGSIVDARNGVVRLTAARDANGVVQTAVFWNTIFRVTQQADPASGGRTARAARGSSKLLTELTLRQKATGCSTKRRGGRRGARAAARKKGGLWGDGKGRFRVRGESSSATVRGTKWYVENRCEGTHTRVVRGVVAVRDFTKKKTIILRAGGTYTAHKRGS